MSAMLPVAVYGLKVPAGDVAIPAIVDLPATFRITMAAIDPSATPEHTGTANGTSPVRATLKVIYDPSGPVDEEDSEGDSEEGENFLKNLLMGRDGEDDDEDDESSSEDEEKNGGPSDPSRTKKARQEAAMETMLKALAQSNEESDDDEDVDMDGVPRTNGITKSKSMKGKGKASIEDGEESEDEEDEEPSIDGMDEQVICTLDPEKNFQQPLDITIPEDQRAYFKVSGTHAIYLTGNYVIPADGGHGHKHSLHDMEDEESDDYDTSPDEDELELMDDDESDELDDLEDPRITDVTSDDDKEAPKLVKKGEAAQKGKNKRAHEESSDNEPPAASLDDIMAKSLKPEEPATGGAKEGEPKLSKKQLKKLKNNAGKAVETTAENKQVKKEDRVATDDAAMKIDKKVQFAKDLEQGPTTLPSTTKSDALDNVKTENVKENGKPKPTLGVKMVQGVKIDDKKLGKGPAAKKGNGVHLRYIGKLQDGRVFDANKKGSPFSFTIGAGKVVKGMDIGVQGMSAGGERRISIPAELGYGKKGSPPSIPPHSELIFDLKMLEVK